jgi:hypothetical protein
LGRYSLLTIIKNLLFQLKAAKTGTHKAEVGARSETNSLGSATLERGKKKEEMGKGK